MPKQKTEQPEYAPDEVNKHGEYIKIGGSPLPGLILRHVISNEVGELGRIAWSPDGEQLAIPSDDGKILLFNINDSTVKTVKDNLNDSASTWMQSYYCTAWSPDGKYLAAGSSDNIVTVWETKSFQPIYKLKGHNHIITSVSWAPSGKKLLSTSDDGTVIIWDSETGKAIKQSRQFRNWLTSAIWSPDENFIVASCEDSSLKVWYYPADDYVSLSGHNGRVTNVIWAHDHKTIISTSYDATVKFWNLETMDEVRSLEGHGATIRSASLSSNGAVLATNSWDGTVRLWRCDTWENIGILNAFASTNWAASLAFNPQKPILATLGDRDSKVFVWDVNLDKVLEKTSNAPSVVHYTTAKLVLVGDSGVGKTGLGWRLAHGDFKEHASTHGQQFWSIPQLGLKREDGTDCEAVLWDLAGQHIYRQVHSIFLENVTAALVLFDPTNRQDPLKGAQFWIEQLRGNGKLPPTVLVGARVDRGAPSLSQAELDQFCQRYGITGGYISTSAMKGDGLDELIETLKKQIPWDKMIATVTTVTFKRIKDYILSLKENPDRKWVLVSPAVLRKSLDDWARSELGESWEFTDAEMMTAVGHLDTYRIASVIKSSSGENHILLTPELLINVAATIMLLADKNPRELGSISETELLQGKISVDELKDLEKAEQQILIDAAILRFLEHNICFRETLNDDTLLIFPSLIKQKRPLQDDQPATDDISYVVRGRVENLYASLVVLLGYTPFFTRINQWQYQAQYEMKDGEICGFRSIEEREGEIELILYYGEKMLRDGRDKFQEIFEQFLYQRDVEITRFPSVVCKNGHQQKRATVVERAKEGKTFVFCDECGEKIILPDFEKPQTIGIGASPWLQREEAMARLRSLYEKHLTNIKSYRRGWASPRVYISHLPEENKLAEKIIHDLRDAAVYIVENTEDIKAGDFAIILDTSAYQKAFRTVTSTLANDAKIIHSRLSGDDKRLLSLACEGKIEGHILKQCTPGDFCDETHYLVSLFNLLLELYAIPLNHKGFEPLRKSLHEQWEHSLAGKEAKEMTSALKVFISYSHKDEEFKDELVTMLAGLQRRGVVDAWQDRRIEAGDEWLKEIEGALDTCDMAVLLVSADFLASRFITEKELPVFIKRREKEGMIVVPIFVRDCLWRSEPFMADLQGLPADGKSIITFPKTNGDRDRIWMKIAEEIERRAKEKSG